MAKQHSNNTQISMVERFNSGESASSIARDMGLFTTSVTRVLKRFGIKMRDCKGANHPGWKGGRHEKYGYVKIWMPTHHRANHIGYVSEHVLVAEKMFGRKINKDEQIHHIDFIRNNNNPNNLWVTNESNHKHAERSIQKLVKELLDKKIIYFNQEEGIYKLI